MRFETANDNKKQGDISPIDRIVVAFFDT